MSAFSSCQSHGSTRTTSSSRIQIRVASARNRAGARRRRIRRATRFAPCMSRRRRTPRPLPASAGLPLSLSLMSVLRGERFQVWKLDREPGPWPPSRCGTDAGAVRKSAVVASGGGEVPTPISRRTSDAFAVVVSPRQRGRRTRPPATGRTYSSVMISADRPCAISMSLELFSVHAVRSVTASMTSRPGEAVPGLLDAAEGRWTSAPIHGRFP